MATWGRMDILTALQDESLKLKIHNAENGKDLWWNGARWEVSGVPGREYSTRDHPSVDAAVDDLISWK